MTEEHVVLLDEQDKPSGTLEKYAAHTLNTPLHLAFSCWLFNEDGQLLVTRRSLSKKLGQACGRIRFAVIRNKAKPPKRRSSAVVGSNSAWKLPISPRLSALQLSGDRSKRYCGK